MRKLPLRKALSYLVTAAGFVTALASVSFAQQFRDVSTEVGLVLEAKYSWGNPIRGDPRDEPCAAREMHS